MALTGKYISSPYFTVSKRLGASESVNYELAEKDSDSGLHYADYSPFRQMVIANPNTNEISITLDDGSDKIYIQGGTEKSINSQGFRRFVLTNEDAVEQTKFTRITFFRQVSGDDVAVEMGKRQNLFANANPINFGLVQR